MSLICSLQQLKYDKNALLLRFLFNKPFLYQICNSILWLQVELDRSLKHLVLDEASLLELVHLMVDSNLCCCLMLMGLTFIVRTMTSVVMQAKRRRSRVAFSRGVHNIFYSKDLNLSYFLLCAILNSAFSASIVLLMFLNIYTTICSA